MQFGRNAAVDGLVVYPKTFVFVVADNWLYKHSLVEKPRISPGFLSGLARASDGNLALHRRPCVLGDSKNVTAIGMFGRIYSALLDVYIISMTFTGDKEPF